jgi:hypothetical protein
MQDEEGVVMVGVPQIFRKAVSGLDKMVAINMIFDIVNNPESSQLLKEALEAEFIDDPLLFYNMYVKPLQGLNINLDVSGSVKTQGALDSLANLSAEELVNLHSIALKMGANDSAN